MDTDRSLFILIWMIEKRDRYVAFSSEPKSHNWFESHWSLRGMSSRLYIYAQNAKGNWNSKLWNISEHWSLELAISKFLSKRSHLDCFQVPPYTSAALFLCLYLFVSLSPRTSPPRESQFPSDLVLGLLFLPFHNFMFNFNVSVVRPISSRFTSPPAESLRLLCDLHIFVKFAKQKIPYPR